MPVWLISLLVGVALQLAGQIVSSMSRQDAQQQRPSGVRSSLQSGGDLSPRFIVGRYGTAGQLRYAGTWGTAGETPNAYFSRVVEVSCLPVRGFAGWVVNGKRVTLADTPTGDLGYAVLEYRRDGTDHLWITPYLGDQTTEDPLMLARFGADPDRPYAGMIGRGCAYFVATALYNRELFNGLPTVLAECDGIELDDPRGDDEHDNPIVAAYTLLKGLTYDGEWVYGPQGISDVNFRADNLEAEADKCDASRTLAGGGTEKRFRIGLDVALEDQPHAVVGELLKACSGRWADVGGIYRFLVGDPGDPVVSFTDEDVVISEPQELDPFPGLQGLYNAMTATYPEPAEAWVMREAPPLYSDTLEGEDEGLRLPLHTEFRAVPWAVQVQELMRTAVQDARRFRRHTMTMPAEWWEYEPLDVAAWTSARHGYDAKAHLITMIEDLPNAGQFVALQEIDPTDYHWSSSYQLPYEVAELTTIRPRPQLMTGFTAVPATVEDEAGRERRPSIEVGWPSGLVDVASVRVQVRVAGASTLAFDGTVPYDIADPSPSRILNAVFLPATAYEVRGKLTPFSGRATYWSNQDEDGSEGAWIGVTTDDARLGGDDFYPGLEGVNQTIADVLTQAAEAQRQIREALQRVQLQMLMTEIDNAIENRTLRTELRAEADGITAAYTSAVQVAVSATEAVASRVDALEVTVNDPTTGVNATANLVSSHSVTLSEHDDTLDLHGESIEAIDLVLNDESTGLAAVNSVVSGHTSTLTSHGSSISAHTTAITSLQTQWGNSGADAFIYANTGYAPSSGWSSAIAIQTSVTAGGTQYVAGVVFEAKEGSARTILLGDQIVMKSGTSVVALLDGTGAYVNVALIKDASITSAKIGTAAITSAKIGDLEVGTIKIANNAVTSATSSQGSDYVYSTNLQVTGEVTIHSASYTPTGGSTLVLATATAHASANDGGAYGPLTFRLKRAGSTVASIQVYYDEDGPGREEDGLAVFQYLDTSPGTSSITWTLTVEGTDLAPNKYLTLVDPTLTFINAKK